MEVNFNINDLINELRGIYDNLKYYKSELNRKVRTLNNAYSRKERKFNEFTTYTQKANAAKSVMINSTKQSFREVTQSSVWIDKYFSESQSAIQTILTKAQALGNTQNLTMSQQASLDLLNNFSQQVIQYWNQQKNELKSWKYESLGNFLSEELKKEGEELLTMGELSVKFIAAGSPFEQMINLAREFRSIELSDKETYINLSSMIQSKQTLIESKQFEISALTDLVALANSEISDSQQALQNAISSGESQEVIEQLQKDLEEKQQARDQKLEEINQISSIISTLQEEISSLQKEISNSAAVSWEIRSDIWNKISNKKQVFFEKSQELLQYKSIYMRSPRNQGGGRNINFELLNVILQKITDSPNGFPVYEIRDMLSSLTDKYYFGIFNTVGIINPMIQGYNSEFVRIPSMDNYADDDFNSLRNQQDWNSRQSFVLDSSFYSGVRDILIGLKQMAFYKSCTDELTEQSFEIRYKLDQLNSARDNANLELEGYRIDVANIMDLISEKNTYYSELSSELDSYVQNNKSDSNFLSNIRDMRNQLDAIISDINSLASQQSTLNNRISEVNYHIVINFDNQIIDLTGKLEQIDDEIREMMYQYEQSENQYRYLLNQYLPTESDTIKQSQLFTQMGGIREYWELKGYSNSLGDAPAIFDLKSKFNQRICQDWWAFRNSDFGLLIGILTSNGNSTLADYQTQSMPDNITYKVWELLGFLFQA